MDQRANGGGNHLITVDVVFGPSRIIGRNCDRRLGHVRASACDRRGHPVIDTRPRSPQADPGSLFHRSLLRTAPPSLRVVCVYGGARAETTTAQPTAIASSAHRAFANTTS